jgi:hypothetical protein
MCGLRLGCITFLQAILCSTNDGRFIIHREQFCNSRQLNSVVNRTKGVWEVLLWTHLGYLPLGRSSDRTRSALRMGIIPSGHKSVKTRNALYIWETSLIVYDRTGFGLPLASDTYIVKIGIYFSPTINSPNLIMKCTIIHRNGTILSLHTCTGQISMKERKSKNVHEI